MSEKIIVDEEEPLEDIDDLPFPPRNVKIRCDRWVNQQFDIYEILGKGKFGEVKRCKEKNTGREFAAKFIATPTAQDEDDVKHEIEIMKRLHHKRLLQLYEAYKWGNMMCLVLEVILGGELFDRVISDDFILTENACVCIMRQICEGVQYMHSHNVIHLDMKPENILCLTKTGNRIKIIDFGLARFHNPDKELRVLFGTPEFMAPEVVNYEPITFATDMWSVGVICYVLLSGLSPFMGDADGDTLSNVIKGEYDFNYKEFDDLSEAAKDLIEKLLVIDKAKRLTAAQCLEHPWLKRSTPPPSPNLDLTKRQLRHYVYKRKWQKAFHAVIALRRMGVDIETLTTPVFAQPGEELKKGNNDLCSFAASSDYTPTRVTDDNCDQHLPLASAGAGASGGAKDKKGTKEPTSSTGGFTWKGRGFYMNKQKEKVVSKVQSFGLVFGGNGKKKEDMQGKNKITSQSDSDKENGPVKEPATDRVTGVSQTLAQNAYCKNVQQQVSQASKNTSSTPGLSGNVTGDKIKTTKPPIPPKPNIGSSNKDGNNHGGCVRKWQKGNDRYIVVNRVQDAIRFFTVDDRRDLNQKKREDLAPTNKPRTNFFQNRSS